MSLSLNKIILASAATNTAGAYLQGVTISSIGIGNTQFAKIQFCGNGSALRVDNYYPPALVNIGKDLTINKFQLV